MWIAHPPTDWDQEVLILHAKLVLVPKEGVGAGAGNLLHHLDVANNQSLNGSSTVIEAVEGGCVEGRLSW